MVIPFRRTAFPALVFFLFSLFCTLPAGLAEQSALNYFVDGVEAFQSKNYEGALDAFNRAIELDPAKLEYRYYLALTYRAMERYETSLEILEYLVQKDPANYFKAYFDMAGIFSEQKAYQKALKTLDKAEERQPHNARVYMEKGYVYKGLKAYAQAVECFLKAKDLDPKQAQVVYLMAGAVYLEDEQFRLSEEMMNKAIAVDPRTALAESARQTLLSIKGAKRARRPLYLSSSFAWAYDDNVPQNPVDEIVSPVPTVGRGAGDQFESFLFKGGYKFVNRKDLEVGAGYSLYCIGYKEWTENNVLAHTPQLYLQYNKNPLFLRVQYDFSYFYTGGSMDRHHIPFFLSFGNRSDDKLRMHSIMPTLTILEPYNLKSDIIAVYQDKHYLDGVTPDADYYSGQIIQSYKFPKADIYPRASYRYGYEDADDETSSYRFHEVSLGVSFPIHWDITGDIALTYMRTNYQNFPIAGDRRDNAFMGSISLTRPIGDCFVMQFFYNYTHNDSNVTDVTLGGIDPYKFKKNMYMFLISYNY